MKDFTKWRALFSGVILACLMLVTAPSTAQFVSVGDPSGVANTSTQYPSPYGNYYWGSRQQFLYPASELAAAGLAAGEITAIQFNVLDTDAAQPLEGYQISIGQTATNSLSGWESGLTSVFGPVTQIPVVGLNTFTFSSPFVWDGSSNVVIEFCHSNSSFTDNCHVEWTTPLSYTASYTYRADGTFESNGGCSTTLNSQTAFGVNPDRRPMTQFEGTLASCPPPFDLAVANIDESSADISWTSTGGDVYLEYGESGFTPGTDATANGGTVVGPLAGSTYNLGGLNPQTEYQVFVREECTPGTWSLNNSTTFVTACGVAGTPYFQGFESFASATDATWPESLCVVANPENTTAQFRWNPRTGTTPSNFSTGPSGAHEGTMYAFTEASSGVAGAVATLDMGPIDVSALTVPALSFYYHMRGTDMGTLNVQVSADGITYNTEFSISGQQQANAADPYQEAIVPLPGYAGGTVYLRFEGIRGAGFSSDIAIDAISVGEAPTCFAPTSLVAEVVSETSADVSWDCAGCTGDFYVEFGPSGFTPGTDANAGGGTVVGPIVGNSTTVSPLVANADNDIYVRQDCGVDGFSNNSSVASVFTGYCQGGPTSTFDSNAGEVSAAGLGGSSFSFDHCAAPGGPDAGYLGVLDQTALSVDVADGFGGSVTIEVAACDGSTFTNQHEVWIDWNNNLTFDPGESIGSGTGNPLTETYSILPPPGTPVGTYTMRVMVQETAAAPPLDPCGTFTWGSVTDFSVNVVPPPACDQPEATYTMLPDCGNGQYSIEVDVTSTGDSPGGVVDITNNGGQPDLLGVGIGTYVFGPFTAGPSVVISVEHLGDPVCNIASSALGTDCILCTGGGPSSTADSNIESVEVNGFAGTGISYTTVCPGVTGVQDLTAQSVDIPNGFSYDLTVDLGTCGGTFFTGAATVWVDWNGDFNFTAAEVIGTSTVNPSSNTFTLSPPPGTPVGPKVMRVIQQEGGTLPLNPCASFTWGSVMDFTVNVIADPGCLPPDVDLAIDASSCVAESGEFFVQVTLNSVGDSPGDEVTISNSFDANTITNATVAGSPYVYGPFPSGTSLDVTVEHLGNALCSNISGISYTCPPPNNDCEDVTATTLTDGVTTAFSGNTEGATESAPFTGAPVVWEAFTVTGVCNNVTIEYCGNIPEFFEIFTSLAPSCPSLAGDLIPNSSFVFDLCGDGNPTVFFNDLAAGTYYYPVAGETANNVAGPYSIDITSVDCPPPPTDFCEVGLSSSPGSFITTGSPVNDVLTVGPQPAGSIITDLDVVVDINHTWTSDLTIELTGPCGTTVVLQDGACGSQDDQEAYYDDESGVPFAAWCPSRIGPVIPVEALSAFDNEIIEGDWTLTVTDNVGGDDGTLVQWCLVPTLGDICLAPQVEVTVFDNESVTIDLAGSGCFDPNSYNSFDIVWTGSGGGSALGVQLPYQVTGLNPGTEHVFDVSGNCDSGASPSFGVSQSTLNCAPSELCTYELTLSNSSGTGFGDGIVQIDNGWTVTDYIMDSELETQTWTVLACPGNSISLFLSSPTGTEPSNNFEISLVNSDNVEVFNETGPDGSTFYFASDGCPDCAAVNNIQFSRLASDLIDVNWNNVALVGNVNNILIEVLDGGFTVIASETVPAGSTSASIDLGAAYPFEFVTVQITTLCTNEGTGQSQVFTSLPGCIAADQCEYVFDMSSAEDGWIGSSLDVLLDGSISIEVALESGASGTQTVYTCQGSTISVSAETAGGGIPDETCINTSQWPTSTVAIPNSGAVTTISSCNFASEYASLNLGTAGSYTFTSSVATDYLTFTDASNNVLAAGVTPLEASIPASGTYRLHVNTDSNCGTQSTCRTTTGQFTGTGVSGCDNFEFSLVLNPTTDNVTLVSQTDFCAYDDGDIVYSGTTCPSCFAPIDVVVGTVTDTNADFTWFSNNPAGTAYTVYVGLPGFTPGVDEVASSSGVTAATGAQGPLNIGGLADDTTFEVIVIEDCGAEQSDATIPVSFTTLISGNDCATAVPLTVQAGGGCPAGSTTNSFVGLTYSDEDISCIDFAISPSVDAWYSFNSGSLNAVSLYVTMSAADYLVVDVYDGCTGAAVFCENGFGSPSIIPVDPNTEYVVRVITSVNNTGTHSICVSPPSGCTDPGALNYNELAEFDDGSCYSCGDATPLTVEANGACPANEVAQDMTGANNSLGNFVECIGNTVPFLDEFYTFNSGASTGVEITVSLGTMGFVAIEVFQECLGDAIFCESDAVGGTYGPIGVQPNTEYTVRISTIATEAGTYGICVQDAVPPSGCTDPNAVNFDPIAGIDDGSCIICAAGENGVVLDMTDSFGDGWNGNTYSISDLSDPVNPVVVATGDLDTADEGDTDSFGTDYLCLPDGCYEITVGGGSFPTEVGWTLNGVDGGSVSGGAPATVQFTINSTCPVLGCTDPSALNFDPAATFDDGSCIIGDCAGPGIPFTYCYGNFENSSFAIAPDVPGDNIIVIFEQGTIESSAFDEFTVYDGIDDSAPVIYQNPTGITQLDGAVLESTLGNGLFITITSDGSVSCQSTGTYNEIIAEVFCGTFVTPGCTDPNAVNYDPAADYDDGSCVLPPANDDCVDAQSLTPSVYPNTSNTLGTLIGAAENGTSACIGTNGPDVFYTFNVPLENHYWVNLNPFGGFAGVIEVLDACDGTVVACESGTASAPVSAFIQNLAAGDYIVRVRDFDGNSYLTSGGQFLVNVQSFPTAKVQDNPANVLYACNTTDRQLEDFVGATPQSIWQLGILDYEWLVAEQGGTSQFIWQRGEPNYSSRLDWLNMEYNKTYNVYVRIQLNVPGVGPVWGVHQVDGPDPNAIGAQECTISTSSNVTLTELLPAYQGTNVDGNPYLLCDFAIAFNVLSSENYRWRFDVDLDPNNGNEIIYTRGSGNPSVRLSWVDGLLPGVPYNVAIEVRVDGQWSGYGNVHQIVLGGVPNVAVRNQYCGGTYAPNGFILSESVCEADFYRFRFTPQFAGATRQKTTGSYPLNMGTINPPLAPGTYNVQVQVQQNGVLGDYSPSVVGDACEITISGPTMPGDEPVAQRAETTGNATLFPNPNAGSEVRMELDGLADGNHEVMIQIYDVYGKLIQTDGFGHEGDRMSRLVRFDNELAMGVYMVHVVVDGERFATERLVVK